MVRLLLGLGIGAVLGAAGVTAYLRKGRPAVLNWGATPEEIERAIAGDAILADAELQTTRAITVNAPPSAIWPWLVQMGMRPRAGAYTYDWIERLLGIDIENSDRIMEEYQHIEPGDWLGIDDKGAGVVVREVDPKRSLVVQWIPAGSTWTFALYPETDGTTRLVSRNRLRVKNLGQKVFMRGFMEPGSLVMERKMLLGIKERAERLHAERTVRETAPAEISRS
jgi:hypothetical protein